MVPETELTLTGEGMATPFSNSRGAVTWRKRVKFLILTPVFGIISQFSALLILFCSGFPVLFS